MNFKNKFKPEYHENITVLYVYWNTFSNITMQFLNVFFL